jgi:S-formylglutathione hydrolase FrmB
MKSSATHLALAMIVALFSVSSSAFSCQVIKQTFTSKILSQDTGKPFVENYLALLPDNYDPKLHYGTVYFLHGRDNSGKMILDVGGCKQMDALVAQNKTPFIIIAPDGQNSYWMNGALTHERWADMVTQELTADAESKYSLIPEPSARVIAGISMGGGGAVQISLNYPTVFTAAIGAHSPVFRTQTQASAGFAQQFGTGIDFQNRDPISLLTVENKRLQTPIYFDMGAKDEWLPNTLKCSEILENLHTNGEFHVAEDLYNGHTGEYWSSHLPQYFDWYSSHLPAVK